QSREHQHPHKTTAPIVSSRNLARHRPPPGGVIESVGVVGVVGAVGAVGVVDWPAEITGETPVANPLCPPPHCTQLHCTQPLCTLNLRTLLLCTLLLCVLSHCTHPLCTPV